MTGGTGVLRGQTGKVPAKFLADMEDEKQLQQVKPSEVGDEWNRGVLVGVQPASEDEMDIGRLCADILAAERLHL